MTDITNKLRLTIAGCGATGSVLAAAFSGVDGVEITACCDSDRAKVSAVAAEYGIDGEYLSIGKMLEDEAPDAIVIALPLEERYDAVMAAAGAGVHVFCSSPLASSYGAAVEMVRAVKEAGITAMVNFPLRQLPAVRTALDLARNGELGRIRHFEASCISSAAEDGVLGGPGIHLYDIAEQFCGDFTDLSSVFQSFSGSEEEDGLMLSGEEAEGSFKSESFVTQIRFDGGSLGVIHGSIAAAGTDGSFRIAVYGEKGSVLFDQASAPGGVLLTWGDSGRAEFMKAGLPGNSAEHFIAALRGNAPAVPDFSQALKIQYYLEQSLLSGQGGLRMDTIS